MKIAASLLVLIVAGSLQGSMAAQPQAFKIEISGDAMQYEQQIHDEIFLYPKDTLKNIKKIVVANGGSFKGFIKNYRDGDVIFLRGDIVPSVVQFHEVLSHEIGHSVFFSYPKKEKKVICRNLAWNRCNEWQAEKIGYELREELGIV